jgi:hypothetical protein
MALTGPSSQRFRRREAIRCSRAVALLPGLNSSVIAKLPTTNSAMANSANIRDHTVICVMRTCAKRSHHSTALLQRFFHRKAAGQQPPVCAVAAH